MNTFEVQVFCRQIHSIFPDNVTLCIYCFPTFGRTINIGTTLLTVTIDFPFSLSRIDSYIITLSGIYVPEHIPIFYVYLCRTPTVPLLRNIMHLIFHNLEDLKFLHKVLKILSDNYTSLYMIY